MADDDSKDGPCDTGDELQMGPDLGNGTRPFLRHTADHQLVGGILRPCPEGKPLLPGAVRVTPKPGACPHIFNVEEVYPVVASKSGPAKVNSKKYRENYDTIFGGKTPVGDA